MTQLIPAPDPAFPDQMTALHMAYYSAEWGFGTVFQTKLLAESRAFLAQYTPGRDLLLTVPGPNSALLGCVAIDGSERDGPGNHLRWFITSGAARGKGLGRRLLSAAMAHCDASRHPQTWLTTFAGLDAAAHLYRTHGFNLVSEVPDDQWSGGVHEQRWERPAGQQDL